MLRFVALRVVRWLFLGGCCVLVVACWLSRVVCCLFCFVACAARWLFVVCCHVLFGGYRLFLVDACCCLCCVHCSLLVVDL